MTSSPIDRPVVLVTGAGKGLGRAFAMACAEAGMAVVVNNRIRDGQPDTAGDVVAEIQAGGGKACADHADITAPGAADTMVATALKAFGRLDGLILNAGLRGEPARFENTPAEAFADIMAVNFTAQAELVRAALPALTESPAGRILFVSSSAGLYGIGGFTPYSASKGALMAFAGALAQEHRKGSIRVNVLAPYAKTRMTDEAFSGALGELFSPAAAAPLAAWLAGPGATAHGDIWVTGGNWARRAAMMEGEGGPIAGPPVSANAVETAASLTPARGFPGAEHAFADFAKSAMAAHGDKS
jgi:NAD(P)-dependent dehydrogenase (short-subunit alcohol dehydrogenase family)